MQEFNEFSDDISIGCRIRELRNQRRYSLRALADRSGLNINTLSLIEHGKTSPSVGTLQHLAKALEVPITAFFESEHTTKRIVFTKKSQRPQAIFHQTHMQNLGKDLDGQVVQPFVITLEPEVESDEQRVVHTGHEFVYCLQGCVRYTIEEEEFILEPGDSLVFEAHLPHHWKNICGDQTQFILVLFPADLREELGGRHFKEETTRRNP